MRALLLAAVVAGGILLAAPFVLSSRYIDERGVEILGRVESRREFVSVRHSGWERICEVMVFYTPPDGEGSSYLVARVDPARFDGLRKDGSAPLRYLRRADLPDVPGARLLRDMRLLPSARLAGQAGVDPAVLRALCWIAGGVLLLAIWRMLRWPWFVWAVVAGVLVLLAGILNSGFPRPVPEPKAGMRKALGRVASVSRIAYLFGTNRSRGMAAQQPVQVVGVEFLPAGRSSPVLAVDLIDEGSVPGLIIGAPAVVVYEEAAPRTARLEAGTRRFVARNLNGALLGAALGAAASLGVLAAIAFAGRFTRWGFRRMLPPRPYSNGAPQR